MNGASYHQPDALEQAARDIQRLVAQMPASAPVQEVSPPSANPFDQESHDLLLKSIDQVASDWVAELAHVRQNSEQIEQLVLQRTAKVKGDITALYLLGNAALSEAKRGDDVNAKLARELEKLTEHAA
jgi:hypothetical protein